MHIIREKRCGSMLGTVSSLKGRLINVKMGYATLVRGISEGIKRVIMGLGLL